jgi:hypothetical protein
MRVVQHFGCALPGRQRGAFVDRPRSAPPPTPGAGKDPGVDALAEREEHEEALCAVRVPLHPKHASVEQLLSKKKPAASHVVRTGVWLVRGLLVS